MKWVSLIFCLFVLNVTARADESEKIRMDTEWDGHVKIYGAAVFPKSGTAHEAVGTGANYDGFAQLRLNNKVFVGDNLYTKIHYEVLAGGGGSRRDGQDLKILYPALFPEGLFGPPNDDRRFFDLTSTIHEDRGSFSYHRLDRAMISFSQELGEIRLGRQAVTWGHGFTFNPMDLFNPFAPTDLERDYKMGDDMVLARVYARNTDVELIYVARRDPDTKKNGDENSLGAKFHFFPGDIEMDMMAARHYEDYVAGIGAVGYAGQAAWRCDITATFLDEPSRNRSFYISAVANLDYSWIWLNKNWYGYIELYYNGLSDADYTDHFWDPALSKRLARGELFALGRFYASANINLEVHALVNAYLTPIINLDDGSGILMPRLVYDLSDNIEMTFSGALAWGGHNTEYGGYEIPGTPYSSKPENYISARATWYF